MVKKWISNTFTAVLLLVILLLAYSTVSSRMNGGSPRVLGKEIMTVLSGSMEPKIRTGSVIVVRPVKEPVRETFKPGDVITFRAWDDRNSVVTHRIVEVRGQGDALQYLTKGDNNDAADPQPIPAADVVAQYEGLTIPLLGYVFTWMKTRAGILALIVTPGLLLIVWSMASLFRAIVRMEESEEPEAAPLDKPSMP